ncbi:protein TBATA isoform X1 [Anolis carolinensis]|uniref:protein TBATA isoform X1 n=1 Tax=Anolis carolinensis TaxID=28377 RepID=UPI002F2B8036
MEKLKSPVTSPYKGKDIIALAWKLKHVALDTPLQFSAQALRPQSKSTARFGSLSHHSFFSRHNPHPHRVTHIQGLNGAPVCTVNDEWNILPPHPMMKSQICTSVLGVCGIQRPIGDPQPIPVPRLSIGSLSDAWREELRELAARVTATSFTKKEKKETAADRALCCRSLGCCEFSGLYGHVPEAFFPDVSPTSMAGILRGCETEKSRRETQYSEETGRLIPPPSRAITRHSSHRTHKNNVKNKGKDATMTFQDQELIILEMLCQILQTDSLTSIQQWLLTAGQRDKDLVMGLLQIATANLQTQEWTTNMEENCPQLSPNTSSCSSSLCNLGKNHLRRVCVKTQKPEPIPEEEKPVHVGTAEVLQFHSNLNEKQKQPATK